MNEFEATVCGVHFRDDADVPYSAATTATAEEDEIAFAHVGDTGNGSTLGVLTARRTGEREVVLTINVAGETAAIETMGAALSAAIGNANEAESSVEQIFEIMPRRPLALCLEAARASGMRGAAVSR